MSAAWQAGDGAGAAYDAFAAAYDDFNHNYLNVQWTGRLLARAEDAGLAGKRLLDVACGTGLSFIPMLERGFAVTGCDVSEEMLARARAKVGEAATLARADMRELPAFGEFDLVWALNDPLNYLLDEAELVAALAGMRRNLAATGVLLFDVNTLTAYRNFFGGEKVVEHNGRRFVWQGRAVLAEVAAGGIAEARFAEEGREESRHVHRQRHYGEAEMLAAIAAAGLRCVEVVGELDGRLEAGFDEGVNTKAIYVCRHGRQPGRAMLGRCPHPASPS